MLPEADSRMKAILISGGNRSENAAPDLASDGKRCSYRSARPDRECR